MGSERSFKIAMVALVLALGLGSEASEGDFTPGIQSRRRVGTGLTLEEERTSSRSRVVHIRSDALVAQRN